MKVLTAVAVSVTVCNLGLLLAQISPHIEYTQSLPLRQRLGGGQRKVVLDQRRASGQTADEQVPEFFGWVYARQLRRLSNRVVTPASARSIALRISNQSLQL